MLNPQNVRLEGHGEDGSDSTDNYKATVDDERGNTRRGGVRAGWGSASGGRRARRRASSRDGTNTTGLGAVVGNL